MIAARACLAQMMSDRAERIAFGAAMMVALAGVYLLWAAPAHRMSLEEHVKDGDLSEEVAERRLRLRTWLGALMILAGLGFAILVTVT